MPPKKVNHKISFSFVLKPLWLRTYLDVLKCYDAFSVPNQHKNGQSLVDFFVSGPYMTSLKP